MEKPQTTTFTVQVFLINREADNPVSEVYAVGCHNEQQSKNLFEMLQRMLQVVTEKPIV